MAAQTVTDSADRGATLAEKAAADLEWTELLARVAAGCAGAPAAARARALAPAPSLAEATARVERVAEAMACAERGEPLPVVAVDDLTDVLGRVRRGAVPSGLELRALGALAAAAATLRRYVGRSVALAPRLSRELATDPELDAVGDRIASALEPDGSVSDGASPGVRDARQRVVGVRRDLARKLDAMLSRHADLLRDRYSTERDGRWVIPVRSDAHQRVPGIVLGASASGNTLYVEPAEVTPIVNRLTVALSEVAREEHRVLAELAQRVAEHGEAFLAAYESCLEADVLSALARWAGVHRARPIAPDPEPRIALGGMRHPLLVGAVDAVVPQDITVGGAEALVVSGPNAGGKTVALKSLGLAALMVRTGIPIPAQPESRVGWFDTVLTDFGDEQSIARALSTFSAHVAHLSRILEVAGSRSLVLLDELAGATDPEEGAAFAQAVIEALLARGAVVAVTTHYERLKEAAARDPRFRNASVGFDLERLEPTFRLIVGVPGPSSALAVAQHFGMPAAVVERARALVPDQARAQQELLERLHAEREALHQALEAAAEDAAEQARLRAELEVERAAVREKERARLARESEQLMAEVRQARARLREAAARVGAGPATAAELAAVDREVSGAASVVAVGSELARRASVTGPARRPATAEELTPGARVYLRRLDRIAEVVEAPARGQLRVLAGPLKLAVPLAEVELVTEPSARAAGGQRDRRSARKDRGGGRPGATTLGAGFVPVRTQENTLDLRGERVEASFDRVDAFLDQLLDRGEPVGFVLHGHGTGALKTAVRAHLTRSAYVSRAHPAEPDDGGDAFTVAWLRE